MAINTPKPVPLRRQGRAQVVSKPQFSGSSDRLIFLNRHYDPWRAGFDKKVSAAESQFNRETAGWRDLEAYRGKYAGIKQKKQQAAGKSYQQQLAQFKSAYEDRLKNNEAQWARLKAKSEGQRTFDIKNMRERWAQRGITSQSGIAQKALNEYEKKYTERLNRQKQAFSPEAATRDYGNQTAGAKAAYNKQLKGYESEFNKALSGYKGNRAAIKQQYARALQNWNRNVGNLNKEHAQFMDKLMHGGFQGTRG